MAKRNNGSRSAAETVAQELHVPEPPEKAKKEPPEEPKTGMPERAEKRPENGPSFGRHADMGKTEKAKNEPKTGNDGEGAVSVRVAPVLVTLTRATALGQGTKPAETDLCVITLAPDITIGEVQNALLNPQITRFSSLEE